MVFLSLVGRHLTNYQGFQIGVISCWNYDFAVFFHFLDGSFSRLYGSSGCFGCCSKSTPIIAVDEPSKGLRIQGRTVKKASVSEDFWSTSTCDLDISALQSQRSLSSISVSNQSFSQFSGNGSNSIQTEFVNHGFLRWNQSRLLWIGGKRSENKGKDQDPVLSWNASYESLLGSSKRFPQPIPLSEMVDFLVDIWEHEGLYD